MSDRGEDGYQPHPGDPWHPGWTDSDDDSASEPLEETVEEPKKRKGLFRRRRDDAETPEPEAVEDDADHAAPESFDAAAADLATPEATDDTPADSPVDAPDAAPQDGPQPAWLSDSAPDPDDTLTVDLPSWASDATAGAEGVDGGFVETAITEDDDLPVGEGDDMPTAWVAEAEAEEVELGAFEGDEPADDAGDVEPDDVEPDDVEPDDVEPDDVEPDDVEPDDVEPDDVAAALDALGEADDEVEVVEGPPDDDLGAETLDLDALAALAGGPAGPEEAAASSEYGVAGPEAFDALKDLDAAEEDLSEWEEYAATPEAEILAEDSAPETKRRGIWPFRRGGDADEEAVAADETVEEPGEWEDDGSAIPRQWFADIDEDSVVEPPADLPETEWPVVPVDERTAEPPLLDEIASGAEETSRDPVEPGVELVESPYEAGDEVVAETAADVTAPAEAPDADAAEIDDGASSDTEVPIHGLREAPATPDAWMDGSPSAESVDAVEAADGWDDAPASVEPLESAEDPGRWVHPDPSVESAVDTPESLEDAAPSMEAEPADGWEADGAASTPMAWEPDADSGVAPAAESDEWGAAEGDDLFPDRLELGFDDGTGESMPIRREAFADEEDEEWVTGPVDVSDEATEMLPSDYGGVEDLSDAIYRTAGTQEHRGLAEEIFRAGEEEREWQAVSAAMPGVETGVVGFDDVADLGTGEEYYESRVPSDIGTRILTGVVLAGFFVGSLWVAPEALAGFIAIIVLLGLGELYATLRRRGLRPLPLFGFLGGIALLTTTWFHGPVAVPAALAITTVVTFFVYAFSPLRGDALSNGGLTVLGVGWVVGTAAFAYPILGSDRYRVLVLAIVVITAAMDIGAYAVGRAWGARALAPVLSPNKSVEGLIGGIGVCMLAAAAVGSLLEPFDLMSGIGLGIVVAVAAPLGDLAESMLKRTLGVKDMGSILPGHGGILDRIDALLFVIPAAWVFYQFAGLLG